MKFPQHVQDKARAKLAGEKKAFSPLADSIIAQKEKKKRAPTKTELEARSLLEATGRYSEIRFEAITLKLKNGAAYKPDWFCVVYSPHQMENEITLIECKGTYRMHSHGRSMLAFAQAKLDFPMFDFVLMQKSKDGSWKTS